MKSRMWRTAFACLPVLAAVSAHAAGPEYTSPATIPSRAYINLGILPDGNYAVPALDANHYTEVDCVTGCSGSGGGGGGGGSGPLHSAPTAFSVTLTTTPTQILAAGTPTRISFIAQGSGYCAYSFTSTSPSVTTAGVSTNGYPLSNGSAFNSSSSAVPTSPLYAVCAAGSSMTIYGDYQ